MGFRIMCRSIIWCMPRSMGLPPRTGSRDDNKDTTGPKFDDKKLSVNVRVERDDDVRLTPVWVMCVAPLTTNN